MLASLLTGLRDLRVPLATGFLWLVVLWLIFHPFVPTRDEASGLAAELYQVLGAFGPAALATATTFVAYLVGILTVRPCAALARRLLALALDPGRTGVPLSTSSRIEAEQLAVSTATKMVRAGITLSSDSRSAYEYDDESLRRASELDHPSASHVVFDLASELSRRMQQDVPLVATRLLADNRELFDRYDRADAEAAFRFSVALPLVVAAALLPWRLDAPWWGYLVSIGVGLLVAALLLVDGARKRMESNDAIYQAVFIGAVDFPSIVTAEATVEAKREDEQAKSAPRVSVGGTAQSETRRGMT